MMIVLIILVTLTGTANLCAQRSDAAPRESVSMTSLTAPKNAKKAFESAWKEFFGPRPNYGKVIGDLQEALKIHPTFTEAWVLLGKTRLVLDQEAPAREAFEHAIAADPKNITAYLPLALIELKNGRNEEAARLADRVLAIDPALAEAHLYRAVAYYNLGKVNDAKQSLKMVLRSGEDNLFLRAQFISSSMLADRIRSQLSQWEALDQAK